MSVPLPQPQPVPAWRAVVSLALALLALLALLSLLLTGAVAAVRYL